MNWLRGLEPKNSLMAAVTGRDPVIYRIKHIHHHRQGDEWCVYPMYDFAHPIQDALEGITHSLCSSEFRNHRPLYDWVVDRIGFEKKPHQWEFGRTFELFLLN